MTTLTEDELDTLVSSAIHKAEQLDDAHSPAAKAAWRDVMQYEERLAEITNPHDIAGGVARAGAVRAAIAAGQPSDALRLANQYLADALLPAERRDAINQVLKQMETSAKSGEEARPPSPRWTNGTTPQRFNNRKPHIDAHRP